MSTAPLFRRDEVVYLKSSAEIGKLEPYRISSLKQIQAGRWLYQIDIQKKPPHTPLIGDSFDGRITEMPLFYTEGELITICEALDIICTRFVRQVTALENKIVAHDCANEVPPTIELDAPRWCIGDEIYLDASAKVGFLHIAKVIGIEEVGVQPKSRRTRYCYQIDCVGNANIRFRDDELITKCEAFEKAFASLKRDLTSAEAKRANLCSSI